jgi:hypothetical protein
MPENLTIGFFAFGAVLILISLLGGGFNFFSFGVSTTISNPLIRVTAFILGTTSIFMALNPGMSPFSPAATDTPSPAFTDVPPPTPPPTQTSVQAAEPSLQPTQPSPAPIVIHHTPIPPGPAEAVISYWQNVSDGRYENAWIQLSPGFRQARHNNDYMDYVRGYHQMDLCRIAISNVHVRQQDEYSSVVDAHLTYYTGSQCSSSEFNFEMWLVYDGASYSWLFDKNTIK